MLLRTRHITLRSRYRAIISPSPLNQRSLADQQTPFPTYFQPPPSPPPYKSRYFRSGLYAILSFGLGYGIIAIAPWAVSGMGRTFAEPGSQEDSVWHETLSKQLDNLPTVKNLRSEPEWQEWQAYSSFSNEEKKHRLTSGPMGGVRGVGMQRVFWDEEGKRAVTIMWFGDAVSGWPNTTHGGALSTIMDESLGRVALRSFPAGTGVTANLDVNFRRPVRPGRWYVLYAQTREATERKATIVGRVEDMGGRVCVEATGIFVVPKTMTLRKITGQF